MSPEIFSFLINSLELSPGFIVLAVVMWYLSKDNKKSASEIKTDISDFKKDVADGFKDIKKEISRVEKASIVGDSHLLKHITANKKDVSVLAKDLYLHIGSSKKHLEYLDGQKKREENFEPIEDLCPKQNVG